MLIDFLMGIGIFVFGLCIGSFLNCVLYRLETNQSFLKGRSFCPHCKHSLTWQDLVPVLSFLFLRGACRYCGKKISIQYPVVEISTGLLFLLTVNFQLSGIHFKNVAELFLALYVLCSMILIFVYDLKHFLIPDKVLFPVICVTFFYRLFENLFVLKLISNFAYIGNYMGAAIGASLFFAIIFFISKGQWMGFGDVKLTILMGLLLGFPNILVALFLAFFFGAVIGLALICLQKRGLKSEVPFAPFLIVGTFMALFWGAPIIDWYLNFLA